MIRCFTYVAYLVLARPDYLKVAYDYYCLNESPADIAAKYGIDPQSLPAMKGPLGRIREQCGNHARSAAVVRAAVALVERGEIRPLFDVNGKCTVCNAEMPRRTPSLTRHVYRIHADLLADVVAKIKSEVIRGCARAGGT